jgi:molecular chaperone HscB
VNQSSVSENYFTFFGLSASYNLDLTALENSYRKIQSESHPDRFVTASNTEKLQSMQTATLANEAYLTLKSPGLRGAYLLGLSGIVAIDEKNNQMPADFLMQQIEWREAVEDAENARDIVALENLLDAIGAEAKDLKNTLSNQFKNNQLAEATDSTRKLIFMDKVREDIVKSIEKLED